MGQLRLLAIAVIGPTAGRYYIDITSGGAVEAVHPRRVVRVHRAPPLALYRGWKEPLAQELAGVYQHSDGRPLLGRKLKGKSVREMKDLGLTVSESGGNKE